LLEKPKEPEKNLKEKLEEDGEIYDPYKKIDEKIKDKLRTDEKFRSEFHEFAQSKKAKVMENMSESERKDFEKYIQEMKMEAER
jgi:nitrate/TMAO reductase-like tetraheme cytochrome c subunit